MISYEKENEESVAWKAFWFAKEIWMDCDVRMK